MDSVDPTTKEVMRFPLDVLRIWKSLQIQISVFFILNEQNESKIRNSKSICIYNSYVRSFDGFRVYLINSGGTWWSSWLRQYGTNRKVAGSIPGEVIGFFNWSNSSSCNMALGSTQLLTEWVSGIFLGVKGGRHVRLTTLPPSVSRLSKQNVAASTSHKTVGLHGLSICFLKIGL
jgi:hypothetical protein